MGSSSVLFTAALISQWLRNYTCPRSQQVTEDYPASDEPDGFVACHHKKTSLDNEHDTEVLGLRLEISPENFTSRPSQPRQRSCLEIQGEKHSLHSKSKVRN